MKAMIMCMALLFAQVLNAQNVQEWTRQRSTQQKYLARQIAALRLYAGYAAKGYEVAQAGLSAISKLKNGDLELHSAAFASLKVVNPKIASSAVVAAALSRGVQIVKEVGQTARTVQAGGPFTAEEVKSYTAAFNQFLNAVLQTTSELSGLITAGGYEMSDGERMARIENLFQTMEAHYAFARSQSTGINFLRIGRMRAQTEIEYLKKLNKGQ